MDVMWRILQAVHDTREVYDGCRKTEFCKRNLYLNNFSYTYNANFIFISTIFRKIIFLYYFSITKCSKLFEWEYVNPP